MKLTLEALYMLQLFNDFSDDLSFLPLQMQAGEDRKAALQRAIKKGYEDLQNVGLIVDEEPTEECLEYGYYLKEYHESFYHYQIDTDYFCAPAVDDFKRMTIVITKNEDGSYTIQRTASILFLGAVLKGHKIFDGLDDRVKDYKKSDYESEPMFRLLTYHREDESLRIAVEKFKSLAQDTVYFLHDNSLYEYDLENQIQRSIDGDQLRHLIMKKMKVKV